MGILTQTHNGLSFLGTATHVKADSTIITTFTSSGNVGIGTTSPIAKLQVGGGTSNAGSGIAMLSGDSSGILNALSLVNRVGGQNGRGVRLSFHNNSTWSATGAIETIQTDNTSAALAFRTYNGSLTEKMRITSDGNVGIGTTSPLAKLDIVGNQRIVHSSSLAGLEVYTNSAIPLVPQVRIGRDSAQYYGIFVTDGDARLIHRQDEEGSGTHQVINEIWTNTSGGGGWTWRLRDNAGAFRRDEMSLSNDGLTVYGKVIGDELNVSQHVKATGNNLSFSAGGNQILNIDLNGKIYPQTHNANDLGFNRGLGFRNVYATGLLLGSAATITQHNTVGVVQITTNHGWTSIGAGNSSWSHFNTDRAQFYFAKPTEFNGTVAPYVNNNYDLGSSSKQWDSIRGRYIYQNGTQVLATRAEVHTRLYSTGGNANDYTQFGIYRNYGEGQPTGLGHNTLLNVMQQDGNYGWQITSSTADGGDSMWYRQKGTTFGDGTWHQIASRAWVQAQGYVTSATDSQTLSWNGGNGQLTISNGNTVDLDGRYMTPIYNGANDNSGKADFAVGVGSGDPALSFLNNQVQIGGTDINYDFRLDSSGNDARIKSWERDIIISNDGSTSSTTAKNIRFFTKPSGAATAERVRIDGAGYTYFHGLQLAISNTNSSHGVPNYFRGDSTHLVIGTGGTLHLNYSGNTTVMHGTNWYPSTNGVANLGTTSAYFNRTYTNSIQGGDYRQINDYTGDSTWFIRSNGRFVFANGHDWTQSIELRLNQNGVDNDTYVEFGQRTSNNANGRYKGVNIVKYVGGSKVDGDLRSGKLYVYGDATSAWDRHITLDYAGTDTGAILTDGDGMKLRNLTAGNSFYFRNSSNATSMLINDSSNVAIGNSNVFTTGGTAKLSVVGTIISLGYSNSDLAYFRRLSAGNFQWQTFNNGNSGNIHLQPYGGNVGVGTTTPQSPLSVKSNSTSSANSGFTLIANGSTDIIAAIGEKSTNGGRFHLYDGGTQKVAFFSDGTDNFIAQGNLGIGTTSPNAKLHVTDSIQVDGGNTFGVDNAGHQIYMSSGGTGLGGEFGTGYARNLIKSDGNATILIGGYTSLISSIQIQAGSSATNGVIQLMTKAAERMRINQDGNVGIGTTAPTQKLHIVGNVNLAGNFRSYVGDTSVILQSYNASASNAEQFRIRHNYGNVDIANPRGQILFETRADFETVVVAQTDLYVGDSIQHWGDGGTGMYFPANDIVDLRTAGTQRLYVDASGNVGINTTTPTQKLDVSGNIHCSGRIRANSYFEASNTQTRDKIRVWPDSQYAIGMKSGYTFGSLNNDYAMSFQMNNDNDRGFWWGDGGHTDAQGAMALSTNGKLTVATSVRIGYGESDTSTSHNGALDVNGNIHAQGNVIPLTDRAHTLGLENRRWQIVFCETLDSAGQHEANLQNPEGEKSVGEYKTGTVLVWKGGKNLPCNREADHMRMGVAVEGIESPLIQGAEPVLVTGPVTEGDYLITSEVEGHAKAISRDEMIERNLQDCVFGKALETANGESHLVKVWINI